MIFISVEYDFGRWTVVYGLSSVVYGLWSIEVR